MVLFYVTCCKSVCCCFLGLIFLVAALANGQQGISLKLQGVTIPNNSLVDIDDLLYRTADDPYPTNVNGLHDQALVCVTDLADCCDTPRTVHGEWYYPDGNKITLDPGGGQQRFLSNRGPNEVINGQQFYGSVRLFRRWSLLERGRFHCSLPSADNAGIYRSLFVNIVDFDPLFKPVVISSFGINTAGDTYLLTCSTTLRTNPLPTGIPLPTFQWFFGQNNSASLPPGVTPTATVLDINNIYSSILRFSPLSQHHVGMYTCQLGAGRLAADKTVFVNDPPISVLVTADLSEPLLVGQIGNTLTCEVSGADNLDPTITYRWTTNDGTSHAEIQTKSNTLTLSPLRLSHAGDYTCSVNVTSALLEDIISVSAFNKSMSVIIHIPDPQSVVVSSSLGNIIHNGSTVTLTCNVELSPAVLESEIFLLVLDAQLSRDGTPLALSGPIVSGTTFTYTTQMYAFGRKDSGNYTCRAAIRALSSFSAFLTGVGELSDTARVTTVYNNNSNTAFIDIGQGDCGALLCYTDLIECCRDSDTPVGVGALGQWLYPNGLVVGTRSDGRDFYIERGPSVLRLNRRSNATSTITTGQFCCEIPDATSTNIRICITLKSDVCTSEVGVGVAIGVVATFLIECLLVAPITAAVLALCWKRRKPLSDNSNAVEEIEEFKDIHVYEDPDKPVTTATAPKAYP